MTQSNPESKISWQLLIWLLAAFGVPIGTAATQFEKITENPWVALGLFIIYEAVVFVIGFFGKVWGNLEGKWSERVADWVDRTVMHRISGYRKKYSQHLIYRHRTFDVKGLSTQGIYTLELEQVFVELSLAPQAPHETSTDPIRQMPEELRTGQHPIWEYLASEQTNNLAIIGPPGCGKTTLMKHMTLALAAGQESSLPDNLPILLFLRDHSVAIIADPALTLAQAVQKTLTKWDKEAPEGWFEKQLEQGKCLVMLDGLDEVADLDTRRRVVDWVERQMQAYGNNQFVITSRPHGYRSNPLAGVTVLEVRPFTSAQIKYFVGNYSG